MITRVNNVTRRLLEYQQGPAFRRPPRSRSRQRPRSQPKRKRPIETKKNVEPTVEAPPPEAPHGAAVKIATSAIITAVCTDLVGFIQIESSLPMHSRHWSPNPD